MWRTGGAREKYVSVVNPQTGSIFVGMLADGGEVVVARIEERETIPKVLSVRAVFKQTGPRLVVLVFKNSVGPTLLLIPQ
jgi:hypothetical protein